jgi:hypothetical protein
LGSQRSGSGLGKADGSNTSTASASPNSAPTWRASSASSGRWSHGACPTNFWRACRSWSA